MTAQASTTSTVTMTGGDVLDALAAIRPALSRKRSAFPWERCVHLTVDGAVARMECHTGEVSARVPFDAEGARDAGLDVWVDAQDLQRAVETLAARRGKRAKTLLSVTVTGEDVTITAEGTSTAVAAIDPDATLSEFRAAPTTLMVERERFVGDVAAAAKCAETDRNGLPILFGVQFRDGKIIATDKCRLAYIDLAGTGELPEVIAPAALLAKMLKATAGASLTVGADDERITVCADNIEFTLRTIEGDYPNVDKIVVEPADDRPTLTLPREKMTDLLKPYPKGWVKITPLAEDLLLELYTDREDVPILTTTVPKVGSNTAEHAVSFNCGYLSEAIKSHTGKTATVTTPAPLKPAAVTSDAPGRLHMIQPVRIA